MAVTYTIEPCKGKMYGVYVKAVSNEALTILTDINPSLRMHGPALPACIPVKSNRLARNKTVKGCQKYVKKLKALPLADQLNKLTGLYMLPTEKHYDLTRLQYYRFQREYNGQFLPGYSTPNKEYIENAAMQYAESETATKYKPTVSKTFKGSKKDINELKAKGDSMPAIPKGIKGMLKGIKDQGAETLNRITQRRKRTTRTEFFQKYR